MTSKKYNRKNSRRVTMNKKSNKKIFLKVNKLGSRKNLKKQAKSKRTFSKKTKKHNKKGGFGKPSNPFIGLPWDATNKSYYYSNSKIGVSPGGTPVYPGKLNNSKKQNGGFLQPLVNSFRVLQTHGENVINRYTGSKVKPSPLPMYGQYKKKRF